MGLNVGDKVTIKPDARKPYVLEFQYHAEIVRRAGVGATWQYYVTTGSATVSATDLRQQEFGPFREDQLERGW